MLDKSQKKQKKTKKICKSMLTATDKTKIIIIKGKLHNQETRKSLQEVIVPDIISQ